MCVGLLQSCFIYQAFLYGLVFDIRTMEMKKACEVVIDYMHTPWLPKAYW